MCLHSRTLTWPTWRKPTPVSIGWCASTGSRSQTNSTGDRFNLQLPLPKFLEIFVNKKTHPFMWPGPELRRETERSSQRNHFPRRFEWHYRKYDRSIAYGKIWSRVWWLRPCDCDCDQTLFWKFYILEQQAETGGDQVQTYCGQRRKKVDMRNELDC